MCRKHQRGSDGAFFAMSGNQWRKNSNQSDNNGSQAFLGTGWSLQCTSYSKSYSLADIYKTAGVDTCVILAESRLRHE